MARKLRMSKAVKKRVLSAVSRALGSGSRKRKRTRSRRRY